MKNNRINTYLFTQICKYFLLILFIFLSVAWILQITRLFSVTNFMHIKITDIIVLSLYLIPNIITVIIPFILIFGLLLTFIKLNRDNELIAILSLGLGLKPFKNALILFSLVLVTLFIILNFYLAPKIYEQYKINEHELRNKLDFDKMVFSNFLNLNKTTILDFKKNNNQYEDIFLSFNDEKENIVYAKKGNIISKNNEYRFQLTKGFKISIDKNKQIEKLEFQNYILKFDNTNINTRKIVDKNTFTIIDDYNSKNYLNISFKIIDLILILYVVGFFYSNSLKNVNLNTKNNIFYCANCISVLIINQIFKNSEVLVLNYTIIISILILFSFLSILIKKNYEQN